jgi:uncharacterized protein DUF938
MGEGHRCHECARAHCPGRLAFGLGIASADGIICINMIHISPWEATVGLIKGAAVILLRDRRSISTVHTNAKGSKRRRAIKPSTRAFAIATRTGSATPRSGHRDGTNLRIFGSGYHRNAHEQFERGVPPNVSVSVAGDPPATIAFGVRPILAAGIVDLNCACRPVSSTRGRRPPGVSSGRCSSSLSPFRRGDRESV